MTVTQIKSLLKQSDHHSVNEALKNDPTIGPAVLSAVLSFADDIKVDYKNIGIPDNIYNDTMADISIWAMNYYRRTGFCGISELGWILNHLNLKLFTLGRLQFRPSDFYYNENWTAIKNSPIKTGDRIMEIHIYQDKPLLPEQCDESLSEAPIFFKKFFDYDFDYFTCNSWLLSPVLKEILPKDSNIIQFQNKFDLIAFNKDDNEGYERIFNKEFGSNLKSSLSQKVKTLKEQGIKLGSGIGIIKTKKER